MVFNASDIWSFSAISRVVLWRSESIIALIRSSSTSTGRPERFSSLSEKSPERNLSNQFWHYRSLRFRRHKQHITFCELAMRFSLCENKKAKYEDNVPFDFPFFNERQTKTTQPIKKLFLLIDSWIANYQIIKCVLHLDYASKPKNSTEAIYEWNPQLLSCQPNTCIDWIKKRVKWVSEYFQCLK